MLRPSECDECLRLRARHEQAASEHSRILAQLREALLDGESALVTVLVLSEAGALQGRDDAEAAFLRHVALVHGSGDANAKAR